MSLFTARDLSAGYEGTRVLWDVAVSVDSGELVCVLGPNGAGKTTLASVISGTVPLWRGSIEFDGSDVARWRPEKRARKGIIQVPQGRRLFPELTVVENLEVARFAAKERVASHTEELVFELFPPLVPLRKTPAGRLSGGEQQMVAVARALYAEPRLLILDEPSLGLAPLYVQALYGAVRRIREEGVSILLVEQMVGAALEVADRVVVIESGRVVDSGPAERFRDPTVLARSYLGGSLGDVDE